MAPSAPEPSAAALAALRRLGLVLIATLRARDTHSIFLDPVTGVPHYRTIIKRPMCLSVAEANLNAGLYRTPAKLASALNLIWSNAMLFNAPDTIFHKEAAALKQVAQRGLDDLRAALVRDGHYIPPPSRRPSHGHGQSQTGNPAEEPSNARPPLPPSASRGASAPADPHAGAVGGARPPPPGADPTPASAGTGSNSASRAGAAPPREEKVETLPPPPVRERDIFVGPKLASTILKKRPRVSAAEELRRKREQYVRASAPLARRFLASLLDPAVVVQADKDQRTPLPSSDPCPVATGVKPGRVHVKMEADVAGESRSSEAVVSNAKCPSPAIGKEGVPVKSHAGLSLGSARANARVLRKAPKVELPIAKDKVRRDSGPPPPGDEVLALKALLSEYGLPSHFVDSIWAQPAVQIETDGGPQLARECERPEKRGGIVDPDAIRDVSMRSIVKTEEVHASEGGAPGCAEPPGERPSTDTRVKAEVARDAHLLLDDNHRIVMGLRRARAEAVCVAPKRRVQLRAAERAASALLRENIAAVAKDLRPRALARPLDVARVAMNLATSKSSVSKQARMRGNEKGVNGYEGLGPGGPAGPRSAGEAKRAAAKADEAKAGKAKAGEAKPANAKAGIANAVETKAGESNAVETKACDAKAGEAKAVETKVVETNARETKAVEKHADEATAATLGVAPAVSLSVNVKPKPASASDGASSSGVASHMAQHEARPVAPGQPTSYSVERHP